MCERYKKPDTQFWYEDASKKIEIYIVKMTSKDFVCREVNNMRLYSCYFPPNDPIPTHNIDLDNREKDFREAAKELLEISTVNLLTAKKQDWTW